MCARASREMERGGLFCARGEGAHHKSTSRTRRNFFSLSLAFVLLLLLLLLLLLMSLTAVAKLKPSHVPWPESRAERRRAAVPVSQPCLRTAVAATRLVLVVRPATHGTRAPLPWLKHARVANETLIRRAHKFQIHRKKREKRPRLFLVRASFVPSSPR